VECRAAFLGEYWLFAASEPGRSEHAGRFRAGGLLGIDGLWALYPRWILSLGVEGLFATSRMRIDVEGHTMETIPEYGGLLGLGLRFFP
jgi:hypothetical protein